MNSNFLFIDLKLTISSNILAIVNVQTHTNVPSLTFKIHITLTKMILWEDQNKLGICYSRIYLALNELIRVKLQCPHRTENLI
jgi:hypothetical protein